MDPSRRPHAEEIYAEFARRRTNGEEVELEEYCARHPPLANALRALLALEGDATSGGGDARTLPATAHSGGAFHDFLAKVPAAEPTVTAAAGDGRQASPAPFARGERIGRYEIEEAIGEGGFAYVYRARQIHPIERTVALKTLKPGVDSADVLARFQGERQALARMNHNLIATVLDAGITTSGRPYFVMEYVAGLPITRHADEQRLDVRTRLRLFLRVCEAVQHAHQRAIVHRDLKPSNILVAEVDGDGEAVPKVIDFGIAKAIERPLTERTLQTEIGQLLGTPEYMSPEQASTGGRAVDTRSDIYALGVLLYELVCGLRPFDSRRLRETGLAGVQRILLEEEPPLASARLGAVAAAERDELALRRRTRAPLLVRSLRGDLDWITAKAMAKDPDERYAAVSELAADVGRHLDDRPTVAGPPTLRYRVRKAVARHRRALASLAAAAVVVALATGFVAGLAERRMHAREQSAAAAALEEGRRWLAAAGRARVDLGNQRARHHTVRESLAPWLPIWERQEELAAWRALPRFEERLNSAYSRAFLALSEALRRAAPDSPTSAAARRALYVLYEDLETDTGVSLARVIGERQPGRAPLLEERPAPPPHTRVALASFPPGAEVFCFRFVEHESRLLPLPFAPDADGNGPGRVCGAPRLVVERIWAAPLAEGFRRGDRLVSVAGTEVTTRGELAAALAGVPVDAPVTVELERDDARRRLAWVPFPRIRYAELEPESPYQPGRLVSAREQLGMTFEGYPLELAPACRLGTTAEGAPLETVLPAGSYLFVLRKPGFLDTRFPVRLPHEAPLEAEARMLRPTDLPPGFLHVPAGTFLKGGRDPEFLQTLEYGTGFLPDLLVSRFEVTFAEYLEFVRVRAEAPAGTVLPHTEEARRELAAGAPLNVLPIDTRSLRELIHWDGAAWTLLQERISAWPLFGISYLAALEYAHWRTQRDNGRWRYRLPTDEEWEKAARGADGRTFVWGEYLVWSYCFSKSGNPDERKTPPPTVGMFPTDESVYGVRDLVGSVEELTSGRPKPGRRYVSTRGGSWEAEDAWEYRLDTRVGLHPEGRSRRVGLRLVAEPDATPR